MWATAYNNLYRIFCLIYFALLFGCANKENNSLPYYNTADFTPQWIGTEDSVQKFITHTIDDFEFQNQEGEIISQKNVSGKIHIANFFFTSCTSVCPRMTEEFQTIQKEFKDDTSVILLSYTVTPWVDSVERLKKYAVDHGVISGKWHLMTGDKSQLYNLARRSYFAEEELGFQKDSSDFLHTEHLLLVDETGRIRGVYNGTLPLETKRLIDDIYLLKNSR